MKGINITEGVGHYLAQEDLDWLGQMAKQGGSDAGRMLRNQSSSLSTMIIASGGVVSAAGGNLTVTEGWCFWGDELCRIVGQTIADGTYRWFNVSIEPAGAQVQYEDGSTHDVYTERVVRIYAGSSLPAGVQQVTGIGVILTGIDYVDTGWQDITLTSAYTAMSTNPPMLRRRLKQIELKGAIEKATSSLNAIAFSISGTTGPERIIPCTARATGYYTAICRISTSNEFSFQGVGTNELSGDRFYLDGIRFTL